MTDTDEYMFEEEEDASSTITHSTVVEGVQVSCCHRCEDFYPWEGSGCCIMGICNSEKCKHKPKWDQDDYVICSHCGGWSKEDDWFCADCIEEEESDDEEDKEEDKEEWEDIPIETVGGVTFYHQIHKNTPPNVRAKILASLEKVLAERKALEDAYED